MKSFTIARNILLKLRQVRDGRIVSNNNLYTAFNRDPNSSRDRDYVSSQVSELKLHRLADVEYDNTVNPKRRLFITLTDKAMAILEERELSPQPNHTTGEPKQVSLQEIAKLVKKWNQQNPSYRIDPTPKLIDEELLMKS